MSGALKPIPISLSDALGILVSAGIPEDRAKADIAAAILGGSVRHYRVAPESDLSRRDAVLRAFANARYDWSASMLQVEDWWQRRQRGHRILLDRTGIEALLPPSSASKPTHRTINTKVDDSHLRQWLIDHVRPWPTKPEWKQAARDHFNAQGKNFVDSEFEAAWKHVPKDQRPPAHRPVKNGN